MPTSIISPDLRRILSDLSRRLALLERRQRPAGDTTDNEMIFTLPGALVTSESPPVYLRHGGYVAQMIASLTTGGSTTTTVLLKQNGATVGTLTLDAGVELNGITPRVSYSADVDIMTVAVTAGTGAVGLTVQVRY